MRLEVRDGGVHRGGGVAEVVGGALPGSGGRGEGRQLGHHPRALGAHQRAQVRAQLSRVLAPRAQAVEIPAQCTQLVIIAWETVRQSSLPVVIQLPPPHGGSDDEGSVVDEDLLALPDAGLGLDRDPPVLDVDGVLGVGAAGVVDQAEHGEPRSGLLLPEQDRVGLQDSDGPHHVLSTEVEVAGLEQEVHHVLLVIIPHGGLLLPLLLVVHQEDQPLEPLGVCVLPHEQAQGRDALVDGRLLVLEVLDADGVLDGAEDLALQVVAAAHLARLPAQRHAAHPCTSNDLLSIRFPCSTSITVSIRYVTIVGHYLLSTAEVGAVHRGAALEADGRGEVAGPVGDGGVDHDQLHRLDVPGGHQAPPLPGPPFHSE